jgi:peptidoglycan hydrolase CwlO-like protein
MLRLIKWIVVGSVAMAGTGFFLFGTHTPSYLGTMFGSVRDKVRGQIPVEFELERARKLIQAIDPEIEECKRDVARAEVELEALDDEIRRLDREVAKGQKRIQGHRELLKDNQGNAFSINGVVYSRREILMDMERAFDSVRNQEALLGGKKALVETQTRSVAAARSRLDAVRTEKGRLEDMVVALTAQKRKMDAVAASSLKFSSLDTSNLTQAKELLVEVKKRLDVAQKVIHSDVLFTKGISSEEVQPRPGLVQEVDSWLSGEKSDCQPGK